MHWFRILAAGLAFVFPLASSSRAEGPPSPLHLISSETDLVFQFHQPRKAIETLLHAEVYQQVKNFPAARELLDSTRVRRFEQFRAYFEKELGAPWPELLDRLGGGGAALGVKLGPNPAPVLLVIQGKDAKLMKRFSELGLVMFEQELARQDVKDKIIKTPYQGVETVHLGKEFHAALAGAAMLISNNDKALERGLDLHLGKEKKSLGSNPLIADARRILPANPLASFWLNMETVRQSPEAKALYKKPRDDPNLTVILGGLLDILGRTPYVCGGVSLEPNGVLTTFRMPVGREGMGPDGGLQAPPAGQTGSRPLLEPPGVLFSSSYYFDLARIWLDRKALFNEKQVQALEQFDKTTAPFMAGNKVSRLLTQLGPYHRLVVVNQPKGAYTKQPKQNIPAFALVVELRDPEAFGRSMEGMLRAAALLATTQIKLKLTEEKHGDVSIIGYRFSEEAPLKNDINDIRFNFSPCFTRVGNQYVFCSTMELGRVLVDLLQKEDHSPNRGSTAKEESRFYGTGVAAILDTFKDQLITQTILDQAVPPQEAREQIKTLIDLVRRSGTLTFRSEYSDKEFHYDIRVKAEK
jgi:hypothetical protein